MPGFLEKTLLLATAFVAGCSVPCSGMKYVPERPHEAYFFEVKTKSAPNPHGTFRRADLFKTNQDRKKESLFSIIDRGMKSHKAREYVMEMLREAKKGFMNEPPVVLAKRCVSLLWKDISTDAGNGHYTLDLERGIEIAMYDPILGKVIRKESEMRDSKQSLDEFLDSAPKSPGTLEWRYHGDCDDFAIALVTGYEIMREIAYGKKALHPFWSSLDRGLDRYRIVGMTIGPSEKHSAHMMNASFTFSLDGKRALVEPLEPQCFIKKGGSCGYVIDEYMVEEGSRLNYVHVKKKDGKIIVDKRKVMEFFGRHSAFRVK